jgi:hypothetical protein
MADTGDGGGKSALGKALGGLAGVPNAIKTRAPVRACTKAVKGVVKHSVAVRVRWQDTHADVLAVKCQILLGDAVVHPGPVANGTVNKVGMDAGSYEVVLPEVDADEWDVE